MKSDRRSFFRLLGSTVALLSGTASGEEGPVEIHRATRQTRLRALEERVPRFGGPPASFKPYPGRDRLALPALTSKPALPLADAVAADTESRGFEGKSIPLRCLSRILYFTNGVTGQFVDRASVVQLRAAPSAGALYAGEVYLVAERVQGVSPGVYYYAVKEHELIRVRMGSWLNAVVGAVSQPVAVEGAAAAILLTNVFRRYSWRYGNRGYRFALIDSGHIGENVRLASASADLAWISVSRFQDDALNALLEVDGREEAVCAVHAIGPAGAAVPTSRTVRPLVEKGEAASGTLQESGSLPARYHEATKLVLASVREKRRIPPRGERPAMGPEIALPKLSPRPEACVEKTIRERRSARFFRPSAVRLEELAFALEMAQGASAFERSIGVDLFVAAHRVEGIRSGFYQYRPRERHLAEVQSGDLGVAMIRACLRQEKAGKAAVAFLMVGRIAEAGARWGERSYRQLLIEAGGIGQRIYLAAEAMGHAARNLAAFYDDDLNALLGFDGRREAVLHLTLFGSGD